MGRGGECERREKKERRSRKGRKGRREGNLMGEELITNESRDAGNEATITDSH